ncbi:MAG TPA: hypothetical protein VF519_05380 [Mycobacteriales bacterium]
MITEEQARTLFRVEPGTALDGAAVLSAARRARRARYRRLAAAAVAVTGAAATAAVVAARPAPGARVVQPVATATPAPPLDPAQVGNAVAIARYEVAGEPREAVGYFVRRETALAFCTASLGGAEPVRHGCTSPADPRTSPVALVARDPGSVGEDSPTPGPSSFGANLWYAVVSTDVASGWFVDDAGARHDATVLGDATTPAKVLVADLHGRVFRAIRVLDANGTALQDRARAVQPGTSPIGDPVAVGTYDDGSGPRTVYAYFSEMARPGRAATVMLCTAAVGARDEKDFGCRGPALPGSGGGSPDVGLAGQSPGSPDDGTTWGPLGEGWTLTVVSARVARGVVVDDRGGRHEGTILGDPALPARLLVAETGGPRFRGVEVYDAAGHRLP